MKSTKKSRARAVAHLKDTVDWTGAPVAHSEVVELVVYLLGRLDHLEKLITLDTETKAYQTPSTHS